MVTISTYKKKTRNKKSINNPWIYTITKISIHKSKPRRVIEKTGLFGNRNNGVMNLHLLPNDPNLGLKTSS